MAGWRQNFYEVKNPHKYIGPDLDNVVFRSSWEKHMFEFFDGNPNVLAWASEPYFIEYMKPVNDGHGNVKMKKAKYYPDLYVEYVDADGKLHKELIEIKPEKQTKPSRSRSPTTKLMENYTFAVNTAKWAAAEAWCKERDIEFKKYTEKSIFR